MGFFEVVGIVIVVIAVLAAMGIGALALLDTYVSSFRD